MSQSLAKIYVHLIFSTKNREPVITESINPKLHAYMGGILREFKSPSLEINTQPDHAHLLFQLCRTESLSKIVAELKRSSSIWLKNQTNRFSMFHWQSGFGAFSVSQSGVHEVRDYILNQKEHHRKMSFQDEFRTFLKKYEVAYDERYVWD